MGACSQEDWFMVKRETIRVNGRDLKTREGVRKAYGDAGAYVDNMFIEVTWKTLLMRR